MKLWKNQPCLFCGKKLINFRNVVTVHGGKGWKIHLDCKNKIDQIKKERGFKDGCNSEIYTAMYYIKIRKGLVYQ